MARKRSESIKKRKKTNNKIQVIDEPVPLAIPTIKEFHEMLKEREADSSFDLRRILMAMADRKMEALNLYEPMPIQQAFHNSTARQRIIFGSNRSGKTLMAAIELSRALTGKDPHNRYPKKDGIAYVVAHDEKAIGEVIWKKLASARAFRMIRDEITGRWRSFRQFSLADQARERESKFAPPLIPPRLIKDISWVSKKDNIPRVVHLHNGWSIHFFSSNAEPLRGSDISFAWMNEEISRRDWYTELQARLVDQRGTFIWDATPQTGTEQFYELHEKAEALVEQGVPPNERHIEEFFVTISNNVHLSEQIKREFLESLSEAEKDVRYDGNFPIRGLMVFPEWHDRKYCIDPCQIPPNWTRYVAIDPGFQVCAVLFCAVPPQSDDDGRHGHGVSDIYLYDELYLKGCTAAKFGHEMSLKAKGQSLHAFIIDNQDGQKHETGSGLRIADQYSEALASHSVKSNTTGFEFAIGDMNQKAGIEGIKRYLAARDDATYPLRVLKNRCPNFVNEIKHYRNRIIEGEVSDKPRKRNDHLVDCFRYLVQYGLHHVAPREGFSGPVTAFEAYQKFKKQARGRENYQGLLLG